MTEAAYTTDVTPREAAAAFHRWRTESARAAAQVPPELLGRARRAFEPLVLPGPLARTCEAFLYAAVALPLALLVYGVLHRDGASLEVAANRAGIRALAWAAACAGAAGLIYGIAWLRAVGLPRRAVLREAAQLGQSARTLGLALSPGLLRELEDAELGERAAYWIALESEAREAERMGEAAAKVLRPGVAPWPEVVELLLLGRRSAAVGLYCVGLACLWWPLFRIGVPGWMRLPVPKFPSWPATAVGWFVVAWAVYAASGLALRLWLGCEPEQARRIHRPLSDLSRAHDRRRIALGLLTDPSNLPVAQARAIVAPTPMPLPTGPLERIKYWLFAEDEVERYVRR